MINLHSNILDDKNEEIKNCIFEEKLKNLTNFEFINLKKAKDEDDYEVVEDTIYGIDFEKEIADAIESGNYRKAIRLRYLQCLKTLSDNDAIDWRIHKTPTQYTREFKNEDFKNLTRQYVLVRYGGYKATPEIYEYICDKYKIIVSELSVNMNLESSQKGGDDEA